MKPIITIVGPEASDIYEILNISGGGDCTIDKTEDENGEHLDVVDAIGEIHEIPIDNIAVYIHDRQYYGLEYGEVVLEENVDFNDVEFTEKNFEGEPELVLGIE